MNENVIENKFDSIIDTQIEKLPKEVMFCKKCVISNQRPRIEFDDEGVCNACRFSEYKNKIDWSDRENN